MTREVLPVLALVTGVGPLMSQTRPTLEGALQGRTSRGNIEAMLKLDPGVSREDLFEAMRGHVVAAGELVGTFTAPSTPSSRRGKST